MKKVIAIIALISCSAAAAYSATTWTYPSAAGTFTLGSTKTLAIKPSANVGFAYDGGSTGVTYVIGSYHAQGNRVFGTSSTDTNIFYKDITAPGIGTALTGTDLPAAPAAGVGAYGAGWTASK